MCMYDSVCVCVTVRAYVQQCVRMCNSALCVSAYVSIVCVPFSLFVVCYHKHRIFHVS